MEEIELINVSDAAQILLTSASNVRRLERMGKLRAIRVGTSQMRVFSRASVERLAAVRQARVKTAPTAGTRHGDSEPVK